jgi:hypothetical protein
LLSVLVQDGLGEDCVAPLVLAAIEAAQVVPNGWVVIAMAPVHSSFTGGAGTSCTQKLKLALLVVLTVQNRIK